LPHAFMPAWQDGGLARLYYDQTGGTAQNIHSARGAADRTTPL